jgi:dinuclear metal center YbgI/SA1388 family protein
MTVSRAIILAYCGELLSTGTFQDYCVNGLQVEGKEEIDHLVSAVSCSGQLFEQAVTLRADLILVHHGLFWKSDPHPFTIQGVSRARLTCLLRHDINLAAYHLPLDAHPELGNNACLARSLGATIMAPFDVGCLASFEPPEPFERLLATVRREIHPVPYAQASGPLQTGTIAIVSGGPGTGTLSGAKAAGADTVLVGAAAESYPALAKELGLNLIAAGHYNTEMPGIRALGEHLARKFGLHHSFVDIPNPL